MAKRLLEQIKNFFSQAKGEVEELRAEITKTKNDIEAVEASPIDLATAKERIRLGIASIADEFVERRFRTSSFMNHESRPELIAEHFIGADPFQLACWLQPEGVAQRLEGSFGKFLEVYGPGLSPEERASRLATLRPHLRQLEKQEERLIGEAREAGVKIPRRPDADPAVVLGEA